MGFGKAQKQARNIAIKKANTEARRKEEADRIKSLNDSRMYETSISGYPCFMTGKELKTLNNYGKI